MANPANDKVQVALKSKKKIFAAVGVISLLIIGFIIVKFSSVGAETAGDLKILKSEVTETVKFYPYTVGNTNMEVLAVKSSDGTIRTAFNTCQVCYKSGKGYYEQQRDVLICMNCGNSFQLDQIEKAKGGCNPVPIMIENKTEDDENIKEYRLFYSFILKQVSNTFKP